MTAAKRPPAPRYPWDPVMLTAADVSAIKALPAAAVTVINKLCGVGLNPFTAGGDDGRRATDFASGKLWVGHTLRDLREMKMPEPRQRETGPHAVPKGAPPPEST